MSDTVTFAEEHTENKFNTILRFITIRKQLRKLLIIQEQQQKQQPLTILKPNNMIFT